MYVCMSMHKVIGVHCIRNPWTIECSWFLHCMNCWKFLAPLLAYIKIEKMLQHSYVDKHLLDQPKFHSANISSRFIKFTKLTALLEYFDLIIFSCKNLNNFSILNLRILHQIVVAICFLTIHCVVHS